MTKNIATKLSLGFLVLFLIGGGLFLGPRLGERKESVVKPRAVVYYDINCGCCYQYIRYLKKKGFNVFPQIVSSQELLNIKRSLGIPDNMYSCHTVALENYVVEGHIPVEAINKLLTEKPNISGIALPGMPSGSPGMPGPKKEPFKIFSLKEGNAQEVFVEI